MDDAPADQIGPLCARCGECPPAPGIGLCGPCDQVVDAIIAAGDGWRDVPGAMPAPPPRVIVSKRQADP